MPRLISIENGSLLGANITAGQWGGTARRQCRYGSMAYSHYSHCSQPATEATHRRTRDARTFTEYISPTTHTHTENEIQLNHLAFLIRHFLKRLKAIEEQ